MDFLSIPPRESSGPRTSRKYDYQKDLAIGMLLEFHTKGHDYLFVFDYHDDLVILKGGAFALHPDAGLYVGRAKAILHKEYSSGMGKAEGFDN